MDIDSQRSSAEEAGFGKNWWQHVAALPSSMTCQFHLNMGGATFWILFVIRTTEILKATV